MSVSKSMFYEKASHLKCKTVNHPWNENCVCGILEFVYFNAVGTNKFYNIYYLIKLLLKREKMSKDYLKSLLKGLVQSTAFGTLMGTVFITCNCIVLNLLGKWHYYTYMITASVGGLSIFVENPKRRGIAITTFINMGLELVVNQLREWKILTNSRHFEVFFFMICSAIFMYYLRTDHVITKNGGPYVWFFTPPLFPYNRKSNEIETLQVCPHEDTCWKDIIASGLRYFGIGTCFQIMGKSLKHGFKMLSPAFAGNAIFQIRNIYMGLYLACYIATYKAVSCTLCHYQGFDSPLHALPAGFLAGLAYYLQPNISILLAVVSNLLMIGGRHFRDSYNLPKWPYGELTLALCNGLLYHYRVVHPQCCPAFLINMVDTCSSGKSADSYKSFKEAVFK